MATMAPRSSEMSMPAKLAIQELRKMGKSIRGISKTILKLELVLAWLLQEEAQSALLIRAAAELMQKSAQSFCLPINREMNPN